MTFICARFALATMLATVAAPSTPAPSSTAESPPSPKGAAPPTQPTPTSPDKNSQSPTVPPSPSAPASGATSPASGQEEVTRYQFTGLDIEGELRTPALLQFLTRIAGEFETMGIPHRSFMPELARTEYEDVL